MYGVVDRSEGRVPMMSVRTRRVANSVMKKRWTVLSPESRSQAIAILRDIQKYLQPFPFLILLNVRVYSW